MNVFRRRAEAARQEVTEAEAKAAAAGVTSDDLTRAAEIRRLTRIGESAQAVIDARERAAEAEQREQDRHDAVTAHATAVEQEAERIAGTTTVLEASRKRLTGAVKTADKALAALVAAGVEHDALVQQCAGELRAAGLVAEYRDGDETVAFEVGGTPADGLVVAGRWWTRINPVGLAWRAVYGALRAHVGGEWPGSREIRYRHVERLAKHSGGLLDGCPLPEAYQPERSWLATLAERHTVVVDDEEALHLVSDSRREDAERDRQREEREQRDTAARVKQRIKRVERTGEAFFA